MRARPSPRRSGQSGIFLIEAMVAILIFALGILGLVAMGGTAVASQSDAQYRTEASSLADAIASKIALNIDRADETTKAASLAGFAHHATTDVDPCVYSGAATTDPSVLAILNRAANDTVGLPGLPGATDANQQILVDGVGTFNRVVITLCWKTASDAGWRRQTLVTYVN